MLHPLELSQTMFAENPHPLVVVWGGPIGGCLIPLGILGVVFLVARPYAYLARFFAGFCLIANGAYLGGGAFLGEGLDDASLVLRLGGARWPLVLFSLVSVAFGLYLCHGLGPKFGLGEAKGRVDRRAALGAAALVVLVVVELLLAASTSQPGHGGLAAGCWGSAVVAMDAEWLRPSPDVGASFSLHE